MISNEKHYDLIKFEDGDFSLDVKVSPNDDTVWLTQDEIAILFMKAKSTISEHIKNILNGELNVTSVTRKFGKTELSSVKTKPIIYYNLDVILAVGYRVNSKRGTIFRKWANSILKQYLLNGYVINSDRIIAYQSNILNLEANYINIENRIKNLENTIYSANNKLFYEGEILEPYSFLIKLFFLAKNKLIIIDMYADNFLLEMLKEIKIPIDIYTSSSSYLNNIHLKDNIHIINTNAFHDRYIIVDEMVYLMGTSFNSIGKKRFTLTKLNDINKNDILKNK